MDLFLPDDVPLPEGERTLVCSCPKCSVKIELDLTQILEEGKTSYKCAECRTTYVLTRESFASRASRQAGKINCANCGGQLDHSQYCRSCKTIYPDYYAAEFPDAAKKRTRQSRDLFRGLKNISFQWRPSQTTSYDYKPDLTDSEAWQEPVGSNKKKIVAGVGALAIIALVAVGVTFYFNVQPKKQYAASYVMALYGIKMGTDLSIKSCKQISADWASKGQTTPPSIPVDDDNQLNKIKSQTEKYIQMLNDPPKAFTDANDKLLKLNTLYIKVHNSAQNPTGTVTSFAELTQKTENDFQVTVADLKKNLPTELSEELKVAKAKFRGLQDL